MEVILKIGDVIKIKENFEAYDIKSWTVIEIFDNSFAVEATDKKGKKIEATYFFDELSKETIEKYKYRLQQ